MSAEPPDHVAYWSGVIVDGAVFFYAMIDDESDDADDRVYRGATSGPLYARAEDLAPELEADRVTSEPGIFDVVDLGRALVAAEALVDSDDFDAVLTVWNAMTDLLPAAGVPFEFTGSLANKVYDKLFWGLNLPSFASEGRRYLPRWSPRERAKVVQVIRASAERVRALVAPQRELAKPRSSLWADFVIETD